MNDPSGTPDLYWLEGLGLKRSCDETVGQF